MLILLGLRWRDGRGSGRDPTRGTTE